MCGAAAEMRTAGHVRAAAEMHAAGIHRPHVGAREIRSAHVHLRHVHLRRTIGEVLMHGGAVHHRRGVGEVPRHRWPMRRRPMHRRRMALEVPRHRWPMRGVAAVGEISGGRTVHRRPGVRQMARLGGPLRVRSRMRQLSRASLRRSRRPLSMRKVSCCRAAGRRPNCSRAGYVSAMELVRAGDRGDRRVAVVGVVSKRRYPARRLLVTDLLGRRTHPAPARQRQLSLSWPDGRAAIAAVEADVTCGRRDLIEEAGDMSRSKVVHAAVIVKLIVSPVAAVVSLAGISESIVDAAVVSDSRAPIAGVEDVIVVGVVPRPVTGRPVVADRRRLLPVARDPVIFRSIPGPIAGNPQVAGPRNWRLGVDRQQRRGDRRADGHIDLCVRRHVKSADGDSAENQRGRRGAKKKTQWAKHDDSPCSFIRPQSVVDRPGEKTAGPA